MRPHQPLSIDLATMLCVRDLERSLGFYRDQLGAEILERDEHVVLLALGSGLLYLFTKSRPTIDKPTVHLAPPSSATEGSVIVVLRSPDARALYERLVESGVSFMTPPAQPPWGGLRCFAQDPDGYLIEVEEPPG